MRLGSRSARLGAGRGADAATGGHIWISWPYYALERLIGVWIDRLNAATIQPPVIASAGAEDPGRVSAEVSATIDGDDAARRTDSPPAYIER